MRNRVRFFVLLGLGTALLGSACDNGTPCTAASTKIEDVCGAAGFDTLGTSRAAFETACGMFTDTMACQTCVDNLLTDATMCASLASCADECVCAPGTICTLGDGGPGDAGPEEDAGMADGGPPSMCQVLGQSGGTCRAGTSCAGDLSCFEELTRDGMGMPLSLESAFGFPTVVPDPANPDQYLPSDITVPVGFAPGGQCSQACNLGTDTCGACSSCSTSLGGPAILAAIGVTPQTFDINMFTSEANPGICRAECDFDPEERGCQDGYTCDVAENVCLEECTADSQCNVGLGTMRHEGYVAVVDGSATCNMDTGRCEWTPPDGAAAGSPCESNTDCPLTAFCAIGGRCVNYRCNPMAGGLTVECDGVCAQGSETDPGTCYPTCTGPDDCFPGQGCTNAIFLNPATAPTICIGLCGADSDCHSNERCDIGGFQQANLGTCQPYCDPAGTDPGATACAADEVCVAEEGQSYGFCQALNQICLADVDCAGTQACEILADDFFGQCVDGCTSDGDCGAGEECRIQAGGESCGGDGDCPSGVCEGATCGAGGGACSSDDDCTGTATCGGGTCAPSTRGVCRAPDGVCSAPDQNALMEVIQHLRGDPQCIESQRCNATMEGALGTCVDRPVTETDAGTGTSDAGTGTPDAGTGTADAGTDGGS